MAYDPVDSFGPSSLPDRVAAAERGGQRRVRAVADSFHLLHEARIDDRTAAALDAAMRAAVAGVEATLRAQAARLLTARGDAAAAQAVASGPSSFDAVVRAGLFRDAALFGELFARVRLAVLSAAMPLTPNESGDRPTMLARLVQASDRLVSAAAVAMLAAEARRAAPAQPHADLPRAMQGRMAWWVAAALRAQADAGVATLLDLVIGDAVRRATDRQGASVAPEVAAMRLAHAIDPAPEQLPPLLEEAIEEAHLPLFLAIAARGAGLEYERMRDLLIDRDDSRLCVVLRALGLERATIARIGYALCAADAGRDVAAFAAGLDAVMAVTPEAATAALMPISLDPEYHVALLALDGAR